MDERDTAILDELRSNARSPLKEIAHKTGLRPSTVHARIARLKKNGVIERFTVKLNSKKIGENFIVFLLVKTKPGALLNTKDSHVKQVYGVTGEYDLMMKLRFSDIEEFNEFIIRFRKQQSILNTLTMISTATVKE